MRQSWKVSFRADNERAEARRSAGRDAAPAELAGDRPCARGDFCASATRERHEDGTVTRVPAMCYQAFCHADRSVIGECLGAVAATYRRLGASIGDHVVAESLTRSPFGPSIPLRGDIDELQRGLVDAVMTWRERLAAVGRLSMPPTAAWRRRALNGHAATLLDESAPVLLAHLDAVLALEPEPMMRPASSPASRTGEVLAAYGDAVLAVAGGADAGLEFLRLDYLARSALYETPAPVVRLLGVPCRECSRRSLRLAPPKQHDSDADLFSICTVCRDAMDEPDYRAWSKAWARHYEATMTPAQMAAAG